MIGTLTTHYRFVDERNETRNACKRLVRLIHELELGSGGRVPPQEVLRQQFGIRHDTLTAAMHALVQHDMVRRKPKVGTVVVDPNAVIPGLWTVGLLLHDYQDRIDNAFIASLVWALQGHLAAYGCQWRTYYRTIDRGMEPNRIGDFPGLKPDVAAQRIDALVVPTIFHPDDLEAVQKMGVATCRIGYINYVTSGVVIDQTRWASDGVPFLHQAGCRKVGVVGSARVMRNPASEIRQVLHDALQRQGMAGELFWGYLSSNPSHTGVAAGRAVAQSLLQRAPADRPDGLLVQTDVLALGITEVLVNSSYRPTIVALTNRQLPMVFPLPVTRFELDIDNLAATAVKLTVQRIHRPDQQDSLIRVPLELGQAPSDTDTLTLEERVHCEKIS